MSTDARACRTSWTGKEFAKPTRVFALCPKLSSADSQSGSRGGRYTWPGNPADQRPHESSVPGPRVRAAAVRGCVRAATPLIRRLESQPLGEKGPLAPIDRPHRGRSALSVLGASASIMVATAGRGQVHTRTSGASRPVDELSLQGGLRLEDANQGGGDRAAAGRSRRGRRMTRSCGQRRPCPVCRPRRLRAMTQCARRQPWPETKCRATSRTCVPLHGPRAARRGLGKQRVRTDAQAARPTACSTRAALGEVRVTGTVLSVS